MSIGHMAQLNQVDSNDNYYSKKRTARLQCAVDDEIRLVDSAAPYVPPFTSYPVLPMPLRVFPNGVCIMIIGLISVGIE